MTSPDGSGRVLVVEDDAAIRTLIASGLKKAGLDVAVAADGQEGLEAVRAAPPDLILSDWMMPRMDGVAFCQEVKADPALRGIFFVLLTAKTQVQDKIQGLSLGADDYLTKPFQQAELLAKVRASLRVKRLQDDLAERNSRLLELDGMKDEFLGMAAHDLRNPLGVIRLWAESVADGLLGPVTPKQANALAVIQKHADSMLQLINDLLDISKIESGKVELRRADEDLAALLASYVEANAVLADRKGIGMILQAAPGLPNVSVDRERIGEILNNLISNALKFTRPGGKVTLSLSAEGDLLRLDVADTGLGIAPEDLPKLFQKFSQTRTKSTAGERGTGLGLAIVKKLVELHGGGISVSSILGQGTTFSLTLPAA